MDDTHLPVHTHSLRVMGRGIGMVSNPRHRTRTWATRLGNTQVSPVTCVTPYTDPAV